MFSCELKFILDIYEKWSDEKFTCRNMELDLFTKQRYRREYPLDWENGRCSICVFDLSLGRANGPESEEIMYLDFVVKKEDDFIRNIFEPEDLAEYLKISTLENYFENFQKFIQVALLLENSYSPQSDAEFISDSSVDEFLRDTETEDFQDLYIEISNVRRKNINVSKKARNNLYKLICYMYEKGMKFPENSFEIKMLVTKNLLNDIINLMVGSVVIHSSHMTGDIIGYAHDFCNRKLKKNQRTIPVIAHNLFSFDFFFVVKGIRLCVWRTKNIAIGRSNLANVQYVNIGAQVKFIDTIKYYLQSLASYAANVDDTEQQNKRTSYRKIFLRRPNYAQSFASLLDEEKN